MTFRKSSEAFLRSYLDNVRLVGYNSVYVIGSFDRKKTVSTQQQRASMVALAAVNEHTKENPRAAVIGAGFAGVSCAATLLKLGCAVSLFEQKDRLIPMQVNCSDRYLHPTIYDWPNCSPNESFKMAGISWHPGYAHEVARQVIESFDTVTDPISNQFDPNFGLRIERIEQSSDRLLSLISENAFGFHDYDIVFIAIGFGLEKRVRMGQWVGSYWQNSAMSFLDGRKNNPERVLVSGAGDGGLIAVLNCALKFYDHSTLHTEIEEILGPVLIKLVSELENEIVDDVRSGVDVRIIDRYDRSLLQHLEEVLPKLIPVVSEETEVTFNSPLEGVFTPWSSLINRVLVYLLLRAELISFVTDRLDPDMVTDVDTKGGMKHLVQWKNKASRYDHIVVRHGAIGNHFLQTFPDTKVDKPIGVGHSSKISLEDAIPKDVRDYLRTL